MGVRLLDLRSGTLARVADGPAALEQECARLEAKLEAEVAEREDELTAAIEELAQLSRVAGGAARVPLEVASWQIRELLQELLSLQQLLAELHDRTGAPHRARPSASNVPLKTHTLPRKWDLPTVRILAVAFACLTVGAGALVATLIFERASANPQSAPVSLGATPVANIFQTPLPLLAALPANYVFDGGTTAEQEDVTAALAASSFDWFLIPQQVTIHIAASYTIPNSTPGNMFISPSLLDSGTFSWGVVQHEYAHQVDFDLLTTQMRAVLEPVLGGKAWCYGGNGGGYLNLAGLPTIQYGCERFAAMIAWSYWISPDNTMQPKNLGLHYSPLDPAKFRALMAVMLSPGYSNLSQIPGVPAV